LHDGEELRIYEYTCTKKDTRLFRDVIALMGKYTANIQKVPVIPGIGGWGCCAVKEVLRRENQGLKVYPVDGSSVFSMTGTYF
jgi:hypothetical protein